MTQDEQYGDPAFLRQRAKRAREHASKILEPGTRQWMLDAAEVLENLTTTTEESAAFKARSGKG